MIKRLLLSGVILGVLFAFGATPGLAARTAASPPVRLVEGADLGHRSGPMTSVTPAGTPAPVAGSAPAATAALPPVATSAATAQPRRNLLTGPHGLNAPVGPDYTDCTGNSEVPHGTAVVDACHTTAVLFVGHNQGVFTPLLNFVRGDVITWYDGAGAPHRLRIVAVRDVSSAEFPPVLGTYEFQTCRFATLNSPLDRELDAVAA